VADIYQGKIGTISPAIGNYEVQTYISIDRGITGVGDSGVTGTGTLISWNHEQGITGVESGNFTNLKNKNSL